MAPRRCPCGTGLPYAECCGRLHDGTATAGTAEQLMRSRDSAFAVGDPAYLLATWHPSTRPPSLDLDPTRSEEHTSELQSRQYIVCRLLLEKKKNERAHVCTQVKT